MNQKIISKFVPKTFFGKWAVGLGVVLVATTAVEVLFAAAIGGDPAVIDTNRLLSILVAVLSVVFTLSAPLSFIVGIIAIVKHKEWLVGKFLAVLYVLTLLLFLLGEFLFPH